jgi:Uncharacterised nucleotidyltransferase
MAAASSQLLTRALAEPTLVQGWPGDVWTQLLHQARNAGLLGRLALRVQATFGDLALADAPGHTLPFPAGVAGHLLAARRVGRAQQAEIAREARFIDHALASLGAPVVLLKGAAYAVTGLPASQGRVFSDIDIMVPKSHLPQAESLLAQNGWMSTEQSSYNQRYYRQWMHELPPMQHIHRGTVLDVHHTILPQTARLRPSAAKLIGSAVPLAGFRTLHVLAPADMLLHSMTHLFTNDEMSHGLRDLSDLDLLLRHFGANPALWQQLVPRAVELDLTRPLYYALHQLQRVWQTPVPPAVLQAISAFAPPAGLRALMDGIWSRVWALPTAREPGSASRALALQALYLRGHWLRMPPVMLVRHLSIKALGLHKDRSTAPAEPPQNG